MSASRMKIVVAMCFALICIVTPLRCKEVGGEGNGLKTTDEDWQVFINDQPHLNDRPKEQDNSQGQTGVPFGLPGNLPTASDILGSVQSGQETLVSIFSLPLGYLASLLGRNENVTQSSSD